LNDNGDDTGTSNIVYPVGFRVQPITVDSSNESINVNTSKDDTNYKSIEALARNNVRAFLNMTKFTAFRVDNGDYTRIEYTPGSVFIVDKVCTGMSRTKKETVQHNYLKCKDEKGVQIIIHFEHPGEF
jgi:hypothetical protein